MSLRTFQVFGVLTLLFVLLPWHVQAQSDPPTFEIPITISDEENSDTIIFGTSDAATADNNVDDGIDEIVPPAPPAGVFNAHFVGVGVLEYFSKDIRQSGFGTFTFELAYQPSSGNGPIEISWDKSDFPAAVEAKLVDTFGFDPGAGGFSKDMLSDPTSVTASSTVIASGIKIELTVLSPPDAPSGLSASATSPTEIEVDWTDNADNEDAFELERSTDDGSSFTLLTTTAANETDATDSGLDPNTQYCYRVRATNGAGASPYTSPECATTPKAQLGFNPGSVSFALQEGGNTDSKQATLTASVAPGGPVSLAVSSGASWLTAPSNATAGSPTTLTADASGLSEGTYTATVTASDPDYNDGVLNVTLVVSSLEAPSDLAATAASNSSIDLSWTENADDEDNVVVERSTDGGSAFNVLATKAANSTSHTDTGLDPGTEYCYRVQATNGNGASGYSDVACATTQQAALSFNPSSLSFFLKEGSNTDQKSVTVTTDGPGTPSISLSAEDDDTGAAPTWLDLPTGPAIGNALSMTADASGLSVGAYSATVTVTSSTTGYQDATLTVNLTVTPPVVVDWSMILEVSDENDYEVDLELGTGPDATDGDDDGYDRTMPPPPPPGVFDARLTQPNEDYFADYRATTTESTTWTVKFEASENGGPISLNWSNGSMPGEGRLMLTDPANGDLSVDMRSQSSYTMEESFSFNELKIVHSLTTLFEQPVTADWNLLALPVDPLDANYLSVFADVAPTQEPFRYGSGYSEDEELDPGVGYWFDFATGGMQVVEGYDIETMTLDLDEGWNLIGGSVACDVPLTAVDDPDDVLLPNTLYAFRSGYQPSTTIERGLGYWVEAGAAGPITLDCSATGGTVAAATAVPAKSTAAGAPRLIVTDRAGHRQELLLGGDEGSAYAMPPVPPRGAFDARFAGDTRRMTGTEATLLLRGTEGPVRLRLEGGDSARYQIAEDGSEARWLEGGAEMVLADGAASVMIRGETVLPQRIAVAAPYPNPTRGAATLRLDLPETATVAVRVYDVLGRSVLEVPRQQMDAGSGRELSLEAGPLSAGLYLYQVQVRTERGQTHRATGRFTVVR